MNGIRFAFLAFTKGMENNLRVPEEALWSVNLLYSDELYKEIARDAEAKKWYEMALNGGHKSAQKDLDRLADMMK